MPAPPIDRPRPKHLAQGAETPTWWASIDRRRAAIAVGVSMLALPVVVLENLPDRSSAEAVEVVASTSTTATPSSTTTAAAARHIESSRLVTVEPSTTTTTEAPTTTTAPPTTTTAAPRPTTTTTAAPAPTTTTPPPPPPPAPAPTGNTESGGATWYRHAPGGCAHRTLPMGTVVAVTSHANGATATCTVNDRGPFTAGRIIDLDATVFEQLAPLSAGVINVTISF